jgi:predicted amidophosphoribosyltransferase
VSERPIAMEDAACPLCNAPVTPAMERCPDCGYDLAGVGGRPGPFSRAVFAWSAMGLLVVYVITLAIVAATR